LNEKINNKPPLYIHTIDAKGVVES